MSLSSLLKQYKSLNRSQESSTAKIDGDTNVSKSNGNGYDGAQGPFKALYQRLETVLASHSTSSYVKKQYSYPEQADEREKEEEEGKSPAYLSDGDKKDEIASPRIAILFCIIDEFPNELIWRMWLHGHESKYKLYFHTKFPNKVQSPFVKANLLGISYRPNWGSFEIVKAMLALLREATHHGPQSLSHFC